MYDKSLNFKVYLINYTIKDMKRKIYMASLQAALLIFICLLPLWIYPVIFRYIINKMFVPL